MCGGGDGDGDGDTGMEVAMDVDQTVESMADEAAAQVALADVTADPNEGAQEANLQAAYAATMTATEDPTAANMAAAQDAEDALAGDIDEGGLGSLSPAVVLGVNSETGQATMSDLAALNAQDAQGYAITNTTPTKASMTASRVAADLNPDLADIIFGVAGMLPGVGIGATIAGAIEGRGFINLVNNYSDIDIGLPEVVTEVADDFSDLIDDITEGFSNTVTAIGTDIGDTMDDISTDIGDAISGIGTALGLDDTDADDGFGTGIDLDFSDSDVTSSTGDVDGDSTASADGGGVDFGEEDDGIEDLGGGDEDYSVVDEEVQLEVTTEDATVVSNVDTFLDTSATTSLVSIRDLTTSTLGVDEDLGVTPMFSALPRRGSFRRSRVTSAKDRAFGAASLFRPTLSAGISL
jgi:hypothetical protein